MKNDVIQNIIEEIKEIQQQPYENSISALGRKIRVEKLHEQLDNLGYTGERPPLKWNQLLSDNNPNSEK
jgi:hypothetical protein